MEKKVEKAFDFAAASVKQIITLSSAILALTATFASDIANKENIDNALGIMKVSWIFHILAIFFGLWTLFALSGSLQKTKLKDLNTYSLNHAIPMIAQMISFIVALIYTMKMGLSALEVIR